MALAQHLRQSVAITTPEAPDMMTQRLVIIGMPETDTSILTTLAGIFGWNRIDWPESTWTESTWDHAHWDIEQRIQDLPGRAFLFGHIPHSEIALTALAGFRKILLVRELRSVLAARFLTECRPQENPSTMRPDDRSGMCRFLRQRGPMLFGQFLSILTWMAEKDVVISHVEDLRQVDHAAAAQLSKALGIKSRSAATADWLQDADADMTSGGAVRLSQFWSDAAEELFNAFGGCLWNSALGYDQPYHADIRSRRPLRQSQHRSH